jgi:hypothetical protein
MGSVNETTGIVLARANGEMSMPYVLLTFDEIADLFHCDAAGARDRVIDNQWERRRWADGLTRVQVPPEVAHQFMLNYAAKYEQQLSTARELDATNMSGDDALDGVIRYGAAFQNSPPQAGPI